MPPLKIPRLGQLILLALPALLQASPGSHDSPKLFIGGGGQMGALHKQFEELAGPEAKLIVIPTAKGDPNLEAERAAWKQRGFENVYVLHTNDPGLAASPRFAEPIRFATAVWITGGVQQNLSRLYADTPVEKELIALLERGGVIGGSSAGAAIQTKAMLCGGTVRPEIWSGFDLLQGAIIDQHFLKKNRLPRLMDAVRNNPNLIGYGIDEGTALIAENDKLRVIGKSYVVRIKMVDRELQIDAFKAGDELPLPKDEKR